MRLSELVGLDRGAVTLGIAADIRCFDKGRKERVTPTTKMLNSSIKAWMVEAQKGNGSVLFPAIHGERMSPDTVRYLLPSMSQRQQRGARQFGLSVYRHMCSGIMRRWNYWTLAWTVQ